MFKYGFKHNPDHIEIQVIEKYLGRNNKDHSLEMNALLASIFNITSNDYRVVLKLLYVVLSIIGKPSNKLDQQRLNIILDKIDKARTKRTLDTNDIAVAFDCLISLLARYQ